MISSRIGGTIIVVIGGRIFSRNGGIFGSPYASQRAIQTSWGKLSIQREAKHSLLILLSKKPRRLKWCFQLKLGGNICE